MHGASGKIHHSGSSRTGCCCGSGILAITAALLGAKEIKGCDIDEVAVKVAGENADLNGVGDRIAFHKAILPVR